MVHAIAQVDDPYGRGQRKDPMHLAVGLFVEAVIEGHEIENVYIIPRSALRGDQVLVVDGEDRLRFRDVEILRNDRESVFITAGLSPGERVSVSTMQAVSDGMKVRAVVINGGGDPKQDKTDESKVAGTGDDS